MHEDMNVSQSVSHESGPFVQIGHLVVRKSLINGFSRPYVPRDDGLGSTAVMSIFLSGAGQLGAGFESREEADKCYEQLKWQFEQQYRNWK